MDRFIIAVFITLFATSCTILLSGPDKAGSPLTIPDSIITIITSVMLAMFLTSDVLSPKRRMAVWIRATRRLIVRLLGRPSDPKN